MQITYNPAELEELVKMALDLRVARRVEDRVDLNFISKREGVSLQVAIVDADAEPSFTKKASAPKSPSTTNADGSAPKRRGRKSNAQKAAEAAEAAAEANGLSGSASPSTTSNEAPQTEVVAEAVEAQEQAVQADAASTNVEAATIEQEITPAPVETPVETPAEPAPVAETEVAQEVAQTETARPSLFANIQRPNNNEG